MSSRRAFLFTAAAALAREADPFSGSKALLRKLCDQHDVRNASLLVQRGNVTSIFCVGKDVSAETPFLLASISKPMTAAAVMTLVDAGQLKLEDKAAKYLPEFKGGDRGKIAVQHLLTHSSGLPDMLPDNDAMRARHAPLSDFVSESCRTPLLFEPGKQVKYQSMGILLAAAICEKITGARFRDYLAKSVFTPLGMKTAVLGLGTLPLDQLPQSQVAGDPSWNWNSRYWRDLGSPWGGVHASAEDVARFTGYFLKPGPEVLKPATAQMMVTDQNAGLNSPWGIGWQVKPGSFGRACSPRTFGHGGSTGTLTWGDPESGTVFVLLLTKPSAESNATVIRPVSNSVSGEAKA